MARRYITNPAGMAALKRSAAAARAAEDAGDEMKRQISRTAVDSGIVQGRGRFSGLEVEDGADAKGPYARVGSSYFATLIEEFGSANNPPYHTFRRAAEAVGLRFKGGR